MGRIRRVPIEVGPDAGRIGVGPNTVIGYRKDGRPVYAIAGGAVSDADIGDWIPIEYDSNVIQRVRTDSAIERYGMPVPMKSATKQIPRSDGMSVTTGSTYTDDASLNDKITLTAVRFMGRFSVDEDDLSDAESVVNVINTKGEDWAISYADQFDNACLAVSAAANGTTVPFTSIYKNLSTTTSALSYTANDNVLTWDDDLINVPSTPLGTSLYEKLSATFEKVESSKFWSPSDQLVIAAPGWRNMLRLCMDAQGHPIFVQGTGGTPDTLFNVPIAWSRGAKLSATNTQSPAGEDLLFYVNRRFLKRGDRSGPESLMGPARAQDDTDDFSVKFRARRAFELAHPKAAAVLKRVTD